MVDDWEGSLGTLAARLRRATGLTQEQLAERSGLSVRAISSIECGSRHPRRFTLERLGAGLGLSAAERVTLIDLAGRVRPVGADRTGTGPGDADLPVAGRTVELEAVRALLAGQGPGLLVFGGEPGIGKSRLVAEAVTVARATGVIVLFGQCRRGADPYAPIVDALADHIDRHAGAATDLRGCAGLELLLPELSGTIQSPPWWAGQERRLVFHAVTRFLTTIAGSGRVLLALDDLQWAGPDTADLLVHLTRYAAPHVRIVMSYRPGEVAETQRLAEGLADLARLNQVRRMRLEPLPRNDAESLVDSVAAGALDPTRRARILRRAGGLPLFLVELTRAALTRAGDEVPGNLRLAVSQQVAALPEPARVLLRRMAALGSVVAVDRLVEPGEPVERVVDALETSRRHGLLDETRHGYRFRFPLIHELLVRGLGPNRRRLWRPAPATATG